MFTWQNGWKKCSAKEFNRDSHVFEISMPLGKHMSS